MGNICSDSFEGQYYLGGSLLFTFGSVLMTTDALMQDQFNHILITGLIAFDIGCVLFCCDALKKKGTVIPIQMDIQQKIATTNVSDNLNCSNRLRGTKSVSIQVDGVVQQD